MRARARETVVIGKFTTRRSQTAGFGKTSGGFLLLSRLVAPRPALIVHRVAGPAIVI